jgi:uncharacterized protein YkwD
MRDGSDALAGAGCAADAGRRPNSMRWCAPVRWCALGVSLVLIIGLAPMGASAADIYSLLVNLRAADCGLSPRGSQPWRPNALLDAAAARWARGDSLRRAVEASGYIPKAIGGLHVFLAEPSDRLHLGEPSCAVLRDTSLREAGTYRRGSDNWIVFAAGAELAAAADIAAAPDRALRRVNEARQQGHRCGSQSIPAALPVRLSAALSEVADRHARDMAAHHYFNHRDRSGRSPADRVRASGYREQLVGENIAFGPLSTDDAITGWLNSPEHCQNLMDARFKEMGIAYALSRQSPRGIYWVQLLADPVSHVR